MAYDSGRQRVVLFGGWRDRTLVGATWEWDGVDWTARSSATSPSPRSRHRLAYDARRGVTVLFGGSPGGAGVLADTWEWDGTNWLLRQPVHSPQARSAHGMAYDAARGRVVLCGGYQSGPLTDTWEWDGTDWSQRAPGPPARALHAMVYDAARQRVMLFGGVSNLSPNPLYGDTWEWDGTTWRIVTGIGPSPRRNHSMAYDARRQRTVLFGGWGDNFTPLGDTWEWDGSVWTSINAPGLGNRHSLAMAYDAARDRTVLQGGTDDSVSFSDTWAYEPTFATYTPFGSGCAGSAGTPALDTANGQGPWLGEPFTLLATGLPPGHSVLIWLGYSRTVAGPIRLPFDLTPLGMNGCSLLVSTEQYFPVFNLHGSATWTFPIPADPSLLGGTFFNQALVADAAANPFGATVSNGGQGILGGR